MYKKDQYGRGVITPDSMWAYPSDNSAKTKMRDVYKDYQLALNKAKKLKEHVATEFEQSKMFEKMTDAILGPKRKKLSAEELPKISIITSVYDGDEHIEGFMEDITNQTIFETNCELILVDANSPGNEKKVIDKYIKKFPENIKYFKLDEDPGIYGTWNFAIEKSTGDFLTNANLDDRKSPESLEIHATELVQDPAVDLVYSDSFVTQTPNETYDNNTSNGKRYNFEQFSVEGMLRANHPHNNPMWRKTIHDKNGMFDDKFKSAGDWEMWLRSATNGSVFKKVPEVLGLYYFNPKGISTNIENQQWKQQEEMEIFSKYKSIIKGDEEGEIIL